MTTAIPDAAPLDLDSLVATDVPPSEEFGVPDHKASEKPRRNISDIFKSVPKEEKKSAPRKKPLPRKSKGQFVEPLTELYVGIGTMLMMADPVCARAIIEAAPECAKSLDELAYQNDAVRRALISLTQTSAVGMVLFAHMPIIMAVTFHHVPKARAAFGNLAPAQPESEVPAGE